MTIRRRGAAGIGTCLAIGILLGGDGTQGIVSQRGEVAFRVLQLTATGEKGGFPLYIALRNQGHELLRLVPGGAPIVWGFFYDPVVERRKRERQVPAVEAKIDDVRSVVFVRTDRAEEGQNVCRTAEGRIAVAVGKETILETAVDFGLVDDGIYDVVLNLAVLVAPGRDRCAQARYEKGEARLRISVSGNQVHLMEDKRRTDKGP